jgi:hypothetical protein
MSLFVLLGYAVSRYFFPGDTPSPNKKINSFLKSLVETKKINVVYQKALSNSNFQNSEIFQPIKKRVTWIIK